LKKSGAKNFCSDGTGAETSTAQEQKSFLLLFFKKEALPFTYDRVGFGGVTE
jgi:hypothetical protein